MEYEQLLNVICMAADDYADKTGAFPSVLHISPITYNELAAGSYANHDGRLYMTDDNVDMFMDFRVERDRTVPKDHFVLNDSLMYGVDVKYDMFRRLYAVMTVRPDGTQVGEPYYAVSLDKAFLRARFIVSGLGKDYYEYKGEPTY